MELFYLQDSRQIVGNDMMFWAWHGRGYTSDLRKAHVYTKEEAEQQHRSRPSDVPWPKDYIDSLTRPACDIQKVNRRVIKKAGITLTKDRPPRRETYRCYGCGRFLSEYDCYARSCTYCGMDNRP